MKWSLLLVLTLVGAVYIQGKTTTTVKENDNRTPDTTTTVTPGTAITSAVSCRDKNETCAWLERSIDNQKELVKKLKQHINESIPLTPGGRNSSEIIRMLQLADDIENITKDMEEKKSDIVEGNLDVNDPEMSKCIRKWIENLERILKELKKLLDEPIGGRVASLDTIEVETSQSQLRELLACVESSETLVTTSTTTTATT